MRAWRRPHDAPSLQRQQQHPRHGSSHRQRGGSGAGLSRDAGSSSSRSGSSGGADGLPGEHDHARAAAGTGSSPRRHQCRCHHAWDAAASRRARPRGHATDAASAGVTPTAAASGQCAPRCATLGAGRAANASSAMPTQRCTPTAVAARRRRPHQARRELMWPGERSGGTRLHGVLTTSRGVGRAKIPACE
jgi:hypothetical protein